MDSETNLNSQLVVHQVRKYDENNPDLIKLPGGLKMTTKLRMRSFQLKWMSIPRILLPSKAELLWTKLVLSKTIFHLTLESLNYEFCSLGYIPILVCLKNSKGFKVKSSSLAHPKTDIFFFTKNKTKFGQVRLDHKIVRMSNAVNRKY